MTIRLTRALREALEPLGHPPPFIVEGLSRLSRQQQRWIARALQNPELTPEAQIVLTAFAALAGPENRSVSQADVEAALFDRASK
jgi:hypothetical protein